MIRVPGVEPVAEPWRVRSIADVVGQLLVDVGRPVGRPAVLAVDGRSGAGKTTLAARIAAAVPNTAVVHTDDVGWWESFFDWDHLLTSGILEHVHRGDAVCFRPPAWEQRGRPGAIEVPLGLRLLVVEGVGSSRRSLVPFLDGAVWVQSDMVQARHRGVARDGGGQDAEDFWDLWDESEIPFLAEDRPWERAVMVVCGTPDLVPVAHHPDAELLAGRSLRP